MAHVEDGFGLADKAGQQVSKSLARVRQTSSLHLVMVSPQPYSCLTYACRLRLH